MLFWLKSWRNLRPWGQNGIVMAMGLIENLRALAAKAHSVFESKNKQRSPVYYKPVSPLADRLLAEAVQLAEIPSPTEREERRAEFVVQRLNSLGIPCSVEEDGSVMVKLSAKAESDESSSLLFFADLGTSRWNSTGSLARVDPLSAKGAGLADSLGPAALLSLAELYRDGQLEPSRDLLLLFAARALDDPNSDIFRQLVEDPKERPFAAIGLRGFSLGTISTRPVGMYRISVKLSSAETNEHSRIPSNAVDVAVALAQRLGGVRWDSEGATNCGIKRIKAGNGFGHEPSEGLVDIEIESPDANLLEVARTAVIATAEQIGANRGVNVSSKIVGHVPVGDPEVCAPLVHFIEVLMKDLRIKVKEARITDPSSYFSSQGVPSASLALALGREGLEADEVDIGSIEAGRRLLIELAQRPLGEFKA